jgi:hypothetical protein
MQAILAQMKDQDKRTQIAQALAVIGDTFGNMGRAKAGMPGEGFKTVQMMTQMGAENKKNTVDNLTASLAADPKSQTSQMAQMTLLQAMGIKPNDPRAAKILAMPAQAIVSIMSQMNDSVKNQLEREKNQLTGKQIQSEVANRTLMQQVAAENAARENRTAETTAANETLKNIGPVSGLVNPGVREAALNTLKKNMGGGSPASNVPVVHTHADYNALPRGAKYQNANGQMGVKS